MKCSLGISSFLEEIFPILSFSSVSLHSWFKKLFLSLLAFLWNSAFRWAYLSLSTLLFASLLSPVIRKTSSDNHFAYLHFFFIWMVLVNAFCTVLQTSVCSSSGTLSARPNPLIQFVTLLDNHKGFDLGHTFFNLSLDFAIRSSWFEL